MSGGVPVSPHDHAEHVEGCFRCDLSRDEAAKYYDPASNDYELASDLRCCYGWGPPERGCTHRFGHACFRAVGHPGECWDGGDRRRPKVERLPCDTARRPKNWDHYLRAEANR